MQRIDKTVFISYRRTNIPWAVAIAQRLTHSGYDVFFDYTGLASGDFEQVILENIRARAHFLVLLTPSALNACREPRDLFRREIETAIETKRNIVPLLMEGFDFANPEIADKLSGTLSPLRSWNGLRIPAEYFDAAMERLIAKWLSVPLENVVHPPSSTAISAAKRQQSAASAAPTVMENELTAQERFEQALFVRDREDRIRLYRQILQLGPDLADIFNDRGKRKGGQAAIDDFSKAISLRPDYIEAFHNRARVRESQGDLKGAIEDYTVVINSMPESAELVHRRGRVWMEKGNLKDAITDYNEAIRLDPNYKDAIVSRGEAYERDRDWENMLADYSKAYHLHPDEMLSLKLRGHVNGTREDFSEIIRLNPQAVYAFQGRGDAKQEDGDLQGALSDYDEVIRLDKCSMSGYNYARRADIRRRLGDLDGAKEDDQMNELYTGD